MVHYNFAENFRAIYDRAVALYGQGQRGTGTYFSKAETDFLAANGITPQHIYDYAEDHNNYGEPGFEIALTIEMVRRDYFLNVQNGRPSELTVDPGTWPAKTDIIKGVEWLPRILPKARAKLRGELPASVMYPCGGDRAFFTANDIHPAEFLNLVWRMGDNDEALIDWVVHRQGKRSTTA